MAGSPCYSAVLDDNAGGLADQNHRYDNGKLGFVDIEQKAAGLVPAYTDSTNPDFGEVAKAMCVWGHRVSKAGELERTSSRGSRSQVQPAACEGETDAAGDATVGRRLWSEWPTWPGQPAWQRPRRLGNVQNIPWRTARVGAHVSDLVSC
jgi:hypothetical protein